MSNLCLLKNNLKLYWTISFEKIKAFIVINSFCYKMTNKDFLETIIVQDLFRVFGPFRPRALFLCLILDFWLSLLVFCPLTIAVFRGSWRNWDYIVIIIGGCGLSQSIITSVIGAIGMIILIVTQINLQNLIKPDPDGKWFSKQQIWFVFVSRTIIFISLSIDTLLWKGLWEILDHSKYFEKWFSNVLMFVLISAILIPLVIIFKLSISNSLISAKSALC